MWSGKDGYPSTRKPRSIQPRVCKVLCTSGTAWYEAPVPRKNSRIQLNLAQHSRETFRDLSACMIPMTPTPISPDRNCVFNPYTVAGLML